MRIELDERQVALFIEWLEQESATGEALIEEMRKMGAENGEVSRMAKQVAAERIVSARLRTMLKD